MIITIGDNTKQAMTVLSIPDYPFTEMALKNAYRSAAKSNHPDNGGDEEKMKKINEAYSALKNLALQDVSRTQANQAFTKQQEDQQDIFKVFDDCDHCNATGIKRMSYEKYITISCPGCSGKGNHQLHDARVCKHCDGGQFTLRSGRKVDCKACKGTGIYKVKYFKTCYKCHGEGIVTAVKPIYKDITCPVCKGTRQVEKDMFNPVIRKGAVL